AAPVDSTTCPGLILPDSGARPEPDRIPNAASAAVRSPLAALVVAIPSGSAALTPGTVLHCRHCDSVTVDSVNDTSCPVAGSAKARWSAGRPVMAEVLPRAKPAVSPDNSTTSSVINVTTAPIRANRPPADRRSRNATNTVNLKLHLDPRPRPAVAV